MALLALDTSTEYLSFALHHRGRIHHTELAVGQKHAELIIDTLRQFLQSHQVNMAQIEGIAYGSGPGSFTGLRIGCAVAQGLALAHDTPLIGICTLAALALQVPPGYHVISCIDARMGEFYLALYQRQGEHCTVTLSPLLCQPDTLPPLPEVSTSWIGVGNGFQAPQLALHYRLPTLYPTYTVRAREILMLALPQFAAKQGVSAAHAELLYIRNKVALTTAERASKCK